MKYDADGDLVENPNARWAITDTTRQRLRDLETKAFDEGWTPDDLATAVNELIDDPFRAELIADTDLARAQQEGSMAEWRESGVVEAKTWLLSNDHPFEDDCDDNADAGEIPIDEDFPSGDEAPPAHPRCHCDVAAVVGDGESDESSATTLFFE
jgi:hypothetical protein